MKKMTPEQERQYRLKLEIANELGLGDKVAQHGFGALTTAETGRIGGILAARKKSGQEPHS